MMKNNRKTIFTVLIVILVIQNIRGYYIRNMKVDSEFLDGVSDTIMLLEDKRVKQIYHSYKEDKDIQIFLNNGDMGRNSEKEMKIKVKAMSLSTFLYEYNEAVENSNHEEADIKLNSYFDRLSSLKALLLEFKTKNLKVNELWEKGVFVE